MLSFRICFSLLVGCHVGFSMKLSFTTLACPDLDVEMIVRRAKAFGFDGVDFRGTKEGLDVTTQTAFTSGMAGTRSLLA